jgi:hypothetical protein
MEDITHIEEFYDFFSTVRLVKSGDCDGLKLASGDEKRNYTKFDWETH